MCMHLGSCKFIISALKFNQNTDTHIHIKHSHTQALHKSQVLAFDIAVLVEEKIHKGGKVLRLQPIGSKKEMTIRFEVSD